MNQLVKLIPLFSETYSPNVEYEQFKLKEQVFILKGVLKNAIQERKPFIVVSEVERYHTANDTTSPLHHADYVNNGGEFVESGVESVIILLPTRGYTVQQFTAYAERFTSTVVDGKVVATKSLVPITNYKIIFPYPA